MKRSLITVCYTCFFSAAFASADCLEPIPPLAAINDELVRDFADELEAEYQAYFSGLQDFFSCNQALWLGKISEGKKVGIEYQDFVNRRKRLREAAEAR